jgi:hypothetical protein
MLGRHPWWRGGDDVGSAVLNVARELGEWGRNVLGGLEKNKKTRRALEECRRRVVSEESVRREEILKFKLAKLEEKKNLYWRQRAKVHWLQKGDRSTRFFHQYAFERKRRSRINKLVKDDGVVVEDEGTIKNMISNFYKSLFTATAGSRMEELMLQISPKVSHEMNAALLRPFSPEEVKCGLDAIGDLKAPGADGMTSLFYKKYWSTVGEDITKEVLYFLNGGDLPKTWNETIVVLIPKVPNPENLKDLRPISLCNVLYKIASKVLANRLKLILPDIIS